MKTSLITEHKINDLSGVLEKADEGFAKILLQVDSLPALRFLKNEELIVRFLNAGARVFACSGRHSEELHDFIDDVFLDQTEMHEKQEDLIVTTFHGDEALEDVQFFLLIFEYSEDEDTSQKPILMVDSKGLR